MMILYGPDRDGLCVKWVLPPRLVCGRVADECASGLRHQTSGTARWPWIWQPCSLTRFHRRQVVASA